MTEIVKYSGCFVCGDKNPDGLRIRFFTEGEEAVAECIADARFQGFKGIYHGGLTATLLDEIMAKAVLANPEGPHPHRWTRVYAQETLHLSKFPETTTTKIQAIRIAIETTLAAAG